MKLKKLKQETLRFLGNFLLYHGITALCKSLEINAKNEEHVKKLLDEKRNFVLAFWHGSMVVPWFVHKDKRISALVSRSKDGALLDKILRRWDYNVIRGSSHKGGSVALGVLIDTAKNDSPIAITPDGPTGPIRKMKAGAVIVAKKTKVPLILLGVHYDKKKVLNSWDKFEVPLFFSKVNMIYSDPICVDSELSFEDTNKLIEECQEKLNQLQIEAENL